MTVAAGASNVVLHPISRGELSAAFVMKSLHFNLIALTYTLNSYISVITS